jgi:hypothetical protein
MVGIYSIRLSMVRYKLTNDCKHIYDQQKNKILIPRNVTTIFVDLLNPPIEEGICELVAIKAFFPDGLIVVGSVVGFHIKLHNHNQLFDGRFNSDNLNTNFTKENTHDKAIL